MVLELMRKPKLNNLVLSTGRENNLNSPVCTSFRRNGYDFSQHHKRQYIQYRGLGILGASELDPLFAEIYT
jgi:hypothetical protein